MKIILPSLAVLLLGSQAYAQSNLKTLPYPQTKKVDTVTTYFSTKVADPYRWLENDQAPDTKAWVQEQNKVTQNYLAQIPYRDAIRKRLETLWNYEKYGDSLQGRQVHLFHEKYRPAKPVCAVPPSGSGQRRKCSSTPISFPRTAPPHWRVYQFYERWQPGRLPNLGRRLRLA